MSAPPSPSSSLPSLRHASTEDGSTAPQEPETNPYLVEQDGDPVTATIDWAKTITFDIPKSKKVFVGTFTNEWQGVSYGNVVEGKLDAPELSQGYLLVRFQITNYPKSSMLIKIVGYTHQHTVIGYLKMTGAVDVHGGPMETYNGVAKISEKE